MPLSSDFKEFCKKIELDDCAMRTTAGEIAKKLNKVYYDIIGEESDHMYIVGSVGRKTAIKGSSDLDLLFVLPEEIYDKYNGYESGGQSQLLQEVKNVLKERYPKTDISGDGQVVVTEFDAYTVELVPAFINDESSFIYPDTHDGGSWKITKPILEQEVCNDFDDSSNGAFRDFTGILRAWINNVGFSFSGLLIDTLVAEFFEDNDSFENATYYDYREILLNLFSFLKEEDSNQSYWFALGSNQHVSDKGKGKFVKKAKQAYNKQEIDGNTIVVYKPVAEVTSKNKSALQFLDLMSMIDKYSEISGQEFTSKLKDFVNAIGVDFSVVKEYLSLYPDRVYRNIYEGGLMNELV